MLHAHCSGCWELSREAEKTPLPAQTLYFCERRREVIHVSKSGFRACLFPDLSIAPYSMAGHKTTQSALHPDSQTSALIRHCRA